MRGARISIAAGIVALAALSAAGPASASPETGDCLITPPSQACKLLTDKVADRKVSSTAGQPATVNLDNLQVVTTTQPFPAPGAPAVDSDWHIHGCPSGLPSVTIDWGDGTTSSPAASTPLANGAQPVGGTHVYSQAGNYMVHATTSDGTCLLGAYDLATGTSGITTTSILHWFQRGYVVNVATPSTPPPGCTDNSLALGKPKRKPKKVIVKASVKCAGTLAVKAKKGLAKPLQLSADPSKPTTVAIKPSKKGKKRLKKTGKLKLKLTFTFTPTGGSPRVQPLTTKLKPKPPSS